MREVDVIYIKKRILEEATKKFGGIMEFLRSEQGKKFGGEKIRCYFCDNGSISFSLLKDLCEYFGIGILSRKFVVLRKVIYQIEDYEKDKTGEIVHEKDQIGQDCNG